jgi:HK97 family phage prohead protease
MIYERKDAEALGTKHLSAVRSGFKAVADKPGLIQGYGSVFNVTDSYGDIVAPGAFAASLEKWKAKSRMPAMLWQHDSATPIGSWTTMREDSVGLWCEGQLLLTVPAGAQAYEHVKADTIDGLSIGFMTIERTWNNETDLRTLNIVDLWEVSLVTFPANDSARVQSVKSAPRVKTIREFEDFLRDAGFSAAAAKAIAARGFKANPEPREEDGDLAGLLASARAATRLFPIQK